MRISEMRAREDLDAIVHDTLAREFSERLGRTVRVAAKGRGQRWLCQPLLSAYYTPRIGRAARNHLRDDFRWTPVARRVPAQFLLGTALASAPGLRVAARLGFVVDPPIPDADTLLVMPGNRRIRVFDFQRQVCRVLLKAGFTTRVMETELSIRGASLPGPFPPITRVAPDLRWFEEPLLRGAVLPRLPPWTRRAPLEARALAALGHYTAPTHHSVSASAHLDSLSARIRLAAAEVQERYGPDAAVPARHLGALEALAATAETLTVGLTHGDFQPGNIFVVAGHQDVLIIDWEHAATRLAAYDALVFGLGSRSALGLAARAFGFVHGTRIPAGLVPAAADPAWRLATLAVFLLEDLLFYLDESVEVPGSRPSAGLTALGRELDVLVPELGAGPRVRR
jgi:hypothetical protein